MNMEVRAAMAMGEDLGPSIMGMIEEGHEGRCGSDQLEGPSSNDEDSRVDKRKRKKKYYRHSSDQTKELEAFFKINNHPNDDERSELAKKLSLDSKQVKFWFQNRRTQLKMQVERYEHSILKQRMDQLIYENIRMKEPMRNPVCNSCGGPAILGNISIEEHHIMVENARLKDELSRVSIVANKFLGRPISSLANSITSTMSDSSLELGVGRNGFDGFNSVDTTFLKGLDSVEGLLNVVPMMPMPSTPPTGGMAEIDVPFEKSIFVELALRAMDELAMLAQVNSHLWVQSLDGGREVLNHEEYMRTCRPCIGMKPSGFVSEATRAIGVVFISSSVLVETLMDANQWTEMFPCMVGKTSTIGLIFDGMAGSRNCALQLMHAEFQTLSPLVPVRPIKFLRFSTQPVEGVWSVVDVSVESIREFPDAHTNVNCRRLPSGCIVQDMPNGSSKVTWVEHSEYDESVVHHLYRPFLSSGMGFGALRWLSALQRRSAILMSSSIYTEDHAGITPIGRSCMVKLAQRMTRNFCAGVCATMHTWQLIQVGNVDEHVRLIIRNSTGDPGEPPGIVLSATTSVWMPVSPQRLFDFLRNEQLRSEWDELSHGGPMQEMVHIAANGQDHANCISLLRPSTANTNQNTMLILQDMHADASGSLIVYTAIDMSAMQMVMSGGDSTTVAFLPSGFSIVPDSAGSTLVQESGSCVCSGGSLLTLGLQILINNSPSAMLTADSVDTVNNLIVRTIQRIKTALCS